MSRDVQEHEYSQPQSLREGGGNIGRMAEGRSFDLVMPLVGTF
jgi:hypothetical protein